MLDGLLDYILGDEYELLRSFINTAFELFLIGIISLGIGYAVWIGLNMDNKELEAGKSPHSGFCPDYPEWE